MSAFEPGQRVRRRRGVGAHTAQGVIHSEHSPGLYAVIWDGTGGQIYYNYEDTDLMLIEPESSYVPVSRPKQGGKATELMAMEEDVQVATIAQFLHQAEKNTTSFTHNLGFHRQIARRLYIDGVRFVPQEPADLPDDELPGMWEQADFSGGEADNAYRISPERLITELRRRASFPRDTPDRAFLISIRYLFRQSADLIERLQRGH